MSRIEKEILDYATKDEQLKLLRQVLQTSEADADEEDVKEELFEGSKESKVFIRFLMHFFLLDVSS